MPSSRKISVIVSLMTLMNRRQSSIINYHNHYHTPLASVLFQSSHCSCRLLLLCLMSVFVSHRDRPCLCSKPHTDSPSIPHAHIPAHSPHKWSHHISICISMSIYRIPFIIYYDCLTINYLTN